MTLPVASEILALICDMLVVRTQCTMTVVALTLSGNAGSMTMINKLMIKHLRLGKARFP